MLCRKGSARNTLRKMEHGRTTQERQSNMTMQLDQISDWDESSSDSDTSSEMSVLHLEMSMWVDLGSKQLPILRWTPGVASHLQESSPKGAGFCTWLVHEQRHASWVATMRGTKTRAAQTSCSLEQGSVLITR